MICTIWNHEDLTCGHLEQSVRHPELFSLFLPFKSEPCKIFKKHCKIQGFGFGRVQDRAKMGPKSALFLRVKIKRIHCKKQGLGGVPPSFVMHQNHFFCKNTAFSQPSVSPRQEAHFSGLRTCFFTILEVFWEVFFRDAILG